MHHLLFYDCDKTLRQLLERSIYLRIQVSEGHNFITIMECGNRQACVTLEESPGAHIQIHKYQVERKCTGERRKLLKP